MYKPNCTIDDCKLFINHSGKCKNEYDLWINKEKLRGEHLNNIKKLRAEIKKEEFNEYKENLICSLNIFLGHYIDQYNKEKDIYYLNQLKGSIDIIKILINKIQCREFD